MLVNYEGLGIGLTGVLNIWGGGGGGGGFLFLFSSQFAYKCLLHDVVSDIGHRKPSLRSHFYRQINQPMYSLVND